MCSILNGDEKGYNQWTCRPQKSPNLKKRENRLKKNDQRFRALENGKKRPNLYNLRVPEGEEKEGNERVVEGTMTKIVLNFAKDKIYRFKKLHKPQTSNPHQNTP